MYSATLCYVFRALIAMICELSARSRGVCYMCLKVGIPDIEPSERMLTSNTLHAGIPNLKRLLQDVLNLQTAPSCSPTTSGIF